MLVAGGGGYLWWTNRPASAAAAPAQRCPEPLQVLVAEELQPVVESVLAAADRAATTDSGDAAS